MLAGSHKPYPGARRPEETLTDREMEVLALLAEGLSRDEMDERLGISYWTVSKHLANAYEKLGVNSRIEACNWWNSQPGNDQRAYRLRAQLAAAEKTIELFGEDFQKAVEAEVGRRICRFRDGN